jgi:hypothetical protein
MDSGEETIEDTAILAQVRRQARKVQFQSTLAAVVLTVLSLVIPA